MTNQSDDAHRVGEKFCEWVDDPLSPDEILESITLYWLTDTFPQISWLWLRFGLLQMVKVGRKNGSLEVGAIR